MRTPYGMPEELRAELALRERVQNMVHRDRAPRAYPVFEPGKLSHEEELLRERLRAQGQL